MAVSQMLTPGVILGGDFEIQRPIGQGGMGTVYEARQRTTGAQRAIKVMRNGLASDPRFRARFEQEARVVAKIASDHVVQVVGAGVDDHSRVPWIAMELLEGEDLQSWLARGQGSQAEARAILSQLFHALGAAHRVGVVHRDIKPENVFLSRSRVVGVPFMVKVLDFGVAKILSEAKGATVVVGTPAFMAPEQTSTSGEVGPQVDVWALGLLVFRMLAGVSYWRSLAEEHGSPVHLWREVLIDPLVPASERARELGRDGRLPEGFDGWFARSVCRELEVRFADAEAAYTELVRVFQGGGEISRVMAEVFAETHRAPSLLVDGAPSPHAPSLHGSSAQGSAQSASAQAASAQAASAQGSQPQGSQPQGSQPQGSPVVVEGMRRTTDATLAALVPGKTGQAATARVTFREKSERVVTEAARGATLLDVSLANGLPHHHVCGGRARCTTCRVVVLDGALSAGPRTPQEEQVAAQRKWPSSIRLACQLRVLGDMTVRRLVIDDDDRDTVNASVSTEEPSVEEAVVVAVFLPGFAGFAREQLPHDVVHVFNRYLKQICELGLANQGVILRYESSGVLLSFGNREISAKAIADSVRTALRVQARAKQLNGYVLRHFGAQFDTAVGIHAGQILRAPLGHPSRTEQVVFGEGLEGAWAAARGAAASGVSVAATEALLQRGGADLRLGVAVGVAPFGEGREIVDFAKPDVNLLVQSTFEQLEGRWNDFAASFYENLFESEPSVSALFAHTDMAEQRAMLMEVLATAIRGLDRFEELIPVLRDLGGRHVGYGTKTAHYKLVGAALLRTLEAYLGPSFTPEVHLAWMEIYGAVAREMLAGSKAATA